MCVAPLVFPLGYYIGHSPSSLRRAVIGKLTVAAQPSTPRTWSFVAAPFVSCDSGSSDSIHLPPSLLRLPLRHIPLDLEAPPCMTDICTVLLPCSPHFPQQTYDNGFHQTSSPHRFRHLRISTGSVLQRMPEGALIGSLPSKSNSTPFPQPLAQSLRGSSTSLVRISLKASKDYCRRIRGA